MNLKKDIIKIYKDALKAIDTFEILNKNVYLEKNKLYIQNDIYDLKKYENIYVIGFGKASARMAIALEHILKDKIKSGLVITKYGHSEKTKKIKILEGGHPLPDNNSLKATEQLLNFLKQTKENDLVINLISGGGSSLLVKPVNSITLSDKKQMTQILLDCGATINEINYLRKYVSEIKGGKLLNHINPSESISLIISDVINDNLEIIASGPTVPSKINKNICKKIIEKYGIKKDLPLNIIKYIFTKKDKEDVKQKIAKYKNYIIENNYTALKGAYNSAKKLGYNPIILSSSIYGETKEIVKFHLAIAKEIILTHNPVATPACILSGGETTVTKKGKGKGGRNQEFVLAALIELLQNPLPIAIASIATDGTDGPTDAAGAIIDNSIFQKIKSLKLEPEKYLLKNDSYNFFKKTNNLIFTGPTGTNVMDLHIILVE